jgi:hypothetical protein
MTDPRPHGSRRTPADSFEHSALSATKLRSALAVTIEAARASAGAPTYLPSPSPAMSAAGSPHAPSGEINRSPASLADAVLVPLQNEVRAFALAARASGLPPERVVIALKREAERAGLSAASSDEYALVMEPALRWCLDEYYGRRAD